MSCGKNSKIVHNEKQINSYCDTQKYAIYHKCLSVSLGEGGKTGPVAYKDESLQIMFMTWFKGQQFISSGKELCFLGENFIIWLGMYFYP